jgi:membrane protease YdiL (CAAX protease family)
MSEPRHWWIGPLHVVGYLMATLVWIGCLGVLTAVLLFAQGPPPPGATTVIPPVAIQGLSDRVRRNLGVFTPALASLPVAAMLGLVTGQFPSWVADRLRDAMPEFSPFVEQMIGTALRGDLFEQVTTGLAVAVGAPLCEELVFRGYLWSAMQRSAPTWVTWLVTTLLFTGYHLDPAQMIGVLPIAAVLGWVRWQTGSVWPAILLHAVNNSFALAVVASVEDPSSIPTPTWLAVVGLVLTLGGCAALLWLPRLAEKQGEP